MVFLSGSPSMPLHHELSIPPQWVDAVDVIVRSPQTPPIAMICGPKNSGKSTFSRLLLNSLLERYERVGYLDTDVGQPEFYVPGCLSLHVVDECLQDVMTSSMRQPERCFFFGDTSSKRDPECYLNYSFRLYEYFFGKYQSNKHANNRNLLLPLIINTAGWVKGTGFDVLVELLRYISPSHVVQIRISNESKNLPTGLFWLGDEEKGHSKSIEIGAPFRDSFNRTVLSPKNACKIRDNRIFYYFKQCIPSGSNMVTNKEFAHALASISPYQVHITQVKVVHLHCQVPEQEVFHSLNGTIVGLAVSSDGPKTSAGCTPWCVGLGIVRGIDLKRGLLYVITPVSPSKLEKVDLLFQGFIEIPRSLLQVRGCVSPYMSKNVLHKLPDKHL
ncbi:hypothetical protein HPP92_008598 [Vanilla planifolia]|uniref:Polynucleotide 5'-hydroxyl-kinase NOL9 n=1 Tax=Vanilla planifolia TaxID=51239 RepID=A0A835V6J2_VANPL|nr:hypothetical protein HPP92_008786 [Vanilla planifolia]KAG0486503.1 hypothetical protein HPP92_008598 [Vanilla planifolia]